MRMLLHLLLWTLLCWELIHINDGPTLPSVSVGICVKTLKHRFWSPNRISTDNKNWTMFACLLLLSGDIQSNPGPANVSHIYPCGLCEMPVAWEHLDGIACDGCSIWHHRSCIELCSADYDLLARHSHIQWMCCKCESITLTVLRSDPLNYIHQTFTTHCLTLMNLLTQYHQVHHFDRCIPAVLRIKIAPAQGNHVYHHRIVIQMYLLSMMFLLNGTFE